MTTQELEAQQQDFLKLASYKYDVQPVQRGYAGQTLKIDLTSNVISAKPVTKQMKELFTGGRGFCLWLLWNGITSKTQWDDPENEIVIAGGPIGGITAYPGSGKSTVVTISPETHSVIDSNSGGYFGPYLKFSGWDAIEIQGKAKKDVIIYIDGDNGEVSIQEAQLDIYDTHILSRQLTERFAKNPNQWKGVSVVSAGRAADYSPLCGLNISYYDPRRDEVRFKQAARGGSGRVFRDKRIKAIVVKYSNLTGDNNGVADLALIRKAGQRINKEIVQFDDIQNEMRTIGTPHLVDIMDEFDLLPCQNFRFGGDPHALQIGGKAWKQEFDKRGPDNCWFGCTLACGHGVPHVHVQSGPYAGQVVFVNGPEYETLGAVGSNLGIFDIQSICEINFYCDTYAIDTISFGNSMAFAMECYEYGILNKEITGGLELTWGNSAVVFEILHQIARGEGFGLTIGQGVRAMKKIFFEKYHADPALLKDIGMEVKGLEISEYMSKESLAQQGGYALATKGPQHDEAWLIFMDQVLKQIPTFEHKAEALYFFPIWRTWFSLHGLCKLPWNDIIPESNKTAKEPAKVPEHIENYTWLHEGVTGQKVTLDDLMRQSERVYQFQRVFNLRMGFGTRESDIPPYRAMGPATVIEYESRSERYDKQLLEDVGVNPVGMSTEEKMKAMRKYREDRYNTLMDVVYKRRGWTSNGIPTVETLKRLSIDLPEIVEVVEQHIQ
ncbi:MAG TPA: aldehyde ferredoxin oxidoreductase C-terminal domain-containing protein [Anaerolineaceae bacterium]|nr:aldehyde ferredoxin oxidoreductase C-terminal domain-containing protein [Anaerolineaceae bacterium]